MFHAYYIHCEKVVHYNEHNTQIYIHLFKAAVVIFHQMCEHT